MSDIETYFLGIRALFSMTQALFASPCSLIGPVLLLILLGNTVVIKMAKDKDVALNLPQVN